LEEFFLNVLIILENSLGTDVVLFCKLKPEALTRVIPENTLEKRGGRERGREGESPVT
jgi:hypothetical protein